MSSLDLLRNNAATHFGSALFKMSVFNFLKRISDGQLLIVDGSDERKFGSNGMRVSLVIHDKRAYSKLLLGGPIGAAEAYMLGYWSTDNLTGLIRIFSA